jgi:hypothetical protein
VKISTENTGGFNMAVEKLKRHSGGESTVREECE